MSGSTHGERKLASPAPNASVSDTEKVGRGSAEARPPLSLSGRVMRWYFALKYRVFRRERRARDGRRGLVMLQIDALSYAELRRAIELVLPDDLQNGSRGGLHAAPVVLRPS